MSRKLLNKAISALLVLAICSTAFLGCVVNAATSINVKVVVGAVGYDEIVVGNQNQYATTVEISSESDFVAGMFNVVVGTGFNLVGFNVKSAVGADGTEVTAPAIFKNITASGGKVLFQGWNDENLQQTTNYKKVTIQVLLEATAEVAAGVPTAVTVSDVQVTNIDEASWNLVADCVLAGSIHKHNYVAVENDDATVKTYACSVCAAEKYELVENESDLSGVVENDLATEQNGAGYSVNFDTTGNLAIVYATDKIENTVYLATLDENDKVIKLNEAKTVPGHDNKYAFDVTYESGVKSINEVVKAVFVEVGADGKVLSKSTVIQKSIATYCNEILDNDHTDAAKAYAAALLDYATATQEFLGYNTNNPINGGALKGTYTDLTEANNKLERPADPQKWKFEGANLTLTTKPVVRFYLSPVGQTDIKDLEFVVGYGNGDTATYAGTDLKTTEIGKKDYYYIDIKDIAAKDLSGLITITCAGETVKYSIDTYAYGMRNTSIADAAKYLYAYSVALKNAFPA